MRPPEKKRRSRRGTAAAAELLDRGMRIGVRQALQSPFAAQQADKHGGRARESAPMPGALKKKPEHSVRV